MENIVIKGVAMGGKIYSLRMAKRMTQEQLAAVLSISPAAISKWERNLSQPGIEMLWAMADFFDCSIDQLVGRTLAQVEHVEGYDDKKLRLALVGEDLLRCSEISRKEGLRAMVEAIPKLRSGSRFLDFGISYIVNKKHLDEETIFWLLENYVHTLPEAEWEEGHMIVAVLKTIFTEEKLELQQEIIASYIGMDYAEKRSYMREMMKFTRQELVEKYKDKKSYSEATDLLEEFGNLGDFEIQVILRNLDNVTLTTALAGASGDVVMAFLSNLSDRILYMISEDIEHWQGTEEEILNAQRKMLEIGSFCLNQETE